MSKKKKVSVVISVYNEEGNLAKLSEALSRAEQDQYDYEYIYVDDGSSDRSGNVISNLAAEDDRIRLVSFSRNFGHEIAMTAGLDLASGDAVIFMDADLQHPPEILPQFLAKWEEGYRIVLGHRTENAARSWFYEQFANSFYLTLNFLTGFDTTRNHPDFRLLDRHYAEILKQFREHSRMFRGLVYWLGGNCDTASVEFSAPVRHSGHSKYSLLPLAGLALDAIFAFSLKPMKLALVFSFTGVVFSVAMALYLFIPYLIEGVTVPGFLTVIFTVLIMGSAQLFILAVFAEYLGRIHFEVKGRPLYTLRAGSAGTKVKELA